MQDKTNKARKKAAEAYAKELNNRATLLKIAKAEALASKKKLDELKKISKEKKDQLALDKAALALGKGENIFDLDKIPPVPILAGFNRHPTRQVQCLAFHCNRLSSCLLTRRQLIVTLRSFHLALVGGAKSSLI